MNTRIDARIAALEAELNDLKIMVSSESNDAPVKSDRRGMVKLLAAGAVGAVTGAAMLGAKPAAALAGDPVTAGEAAESDSPTLLTSSSTQGAALILNSTASYGLETNGELGNAVFTAAGESPIGTGAAAPGILFVDGVGDWWASTDSANVNAPWRKLASAQSAGQLHILQAPVRVYDSRPGEDPAGIGPKAPTASNTPRPIDTTANFSGVPATANAVMISLTIAGPQGAGFASAWPGGEFPGTSNINFAPGQNIAVTTTVGCGPNASIVIMSNTVTDFLVDVIGYYQ